MEGIQGESAGLHEDIKNGRIPNIDKIIKKYPNEKYFYNDKNESAAAVALKHREIKIYEILISKGLCLNAKNEDANEITKNFGSRIQRIVREINKKYSNDVTDHVQILISKSKISHNTIEGEVGDVVKCIRKVYMDLDQIERIEPILKVIAYADKLSINFDIYSDAINNMDPTSSKMVEGRTYHLGKYEGDIFIGGENLMREDEKYFEALGTLAHEMTHYAMQIVYQNNCKPYKAEVNDGPPQKIRKGDEMVEYENQSDELSDRERFSEISKQCKERRKADPVIDVVFSYPKERWHAELIVRVPHLLALYKNNPDSCDQVESTFSELFEYFEEKTLSDFESVVQWMKTAYKMNDAYRPKIQRIEYYVERNFAALDENFMTLNESQLICYTKINKIILISNEPGAGKTTNLIEMLSKLKRRFPDHWITFIDLKEFSDSYKEDGEFSKAFDSPTEIVTFYCEKIFKFMNFEARKFQELFDENRVIFLMDGFDEISPSYKEFNLRLITAILRESGNPIWIATRPHLENELREKLNCKVFKLSPFTPGDRRKFLELKWKSDGIDKEKISGKIQRVESFLKELSERSQGSDPTSNPLVLSMIADIFDDMSNQQNLQMNLYSIYDAFVNKKLRIYFEKGPEAQKEILFDQLFDRRVNVIAFHQEKALITVLHLANEWEPLAALFFERSTSPSPEEITRLGLMVCEGPSNEFQFSHRTFAEFFVAKFLIESISRFNISEDYGTRLWTERRKDWGIMLQFLPESKDVQDLSIKSGLKMTREMMFNEILEEYGLGEYRLNEASNDNMRMVRHFIYSFWETRFHKGSCRSNLDSFERALSSSKRFYRALFFCAIEDASDSWLKDIPEALKAVSRSEAFWEPWGQLRKANALMLSAKHSSRFFLKCLAATKQFVKPEKLKEMFLEVDKELKNILWYCSLENIELLLSDSPIIPLTRDEKSQMLQAKSSDELNLILHSSTHKSKEEFRKCFEAVRKFDEKLPGTLLQAMSSTKYPTILHYHLKNRCLYSSEEKVASTLEVLKEYLKPSAIKEMFGKKDANGCTPLMLVAFEPESVEVVRIFWDFFEQTFDDETERTSILTHEDDFGFSAFDFVFCKERYFKNVVEYVKEKYKKILSEDEMRQRITKKISYIADPENIESLKSKDFCSSNIITNVASTFSNDFVRSLFLTIGGDLTSLVGILRGNDTGTIWKSFLVENLMFSDEDINSIF